MLIRSRLMILLAGLTVATVAMAGASLWAQSLLQAKTRTIVEDRVLPLSELAIVRDSYANIRDTASEVGDGRTGAVAASIRMRVDVDNANAAWAVYLTSWLTPEGEEIAAKTKALFEKAAPILDQFAARLSKNDVEGVRAMSKDLSKIIGSVRTSVDRLFRLQVKIAKEEYTAAQAIGSTFWMISLGLAGAALVMLVVSALVVFTKISRPLSRMEDTMRKLADNDLAVEIPFLRNKDEIGAMAKAVEVFKSNSLQVQALTADERARSKVAQHKAEQMQILLGGLTQVISAASKGDFSGRIEDQTTDEQLIKVAELVNSLVDTVQKSMAETGSVLHALSQADLTRRVDGEFSGELEQLKSSTNTVVTNLSLILGRLRDSAGSLRSATSEILVGTQDLAERTAKQAANAEETAAAMEELAVTVDQNAQRAEAVSARSKTLSREATEACEVMKRSDAAMERISRSSTQISGIIGLIDDIAFQTNLLALNASVEAARAGDAGKGFAVVATEVRRLAQSAAGASGQVKQLIEQSTAEVGAGGKLVADANSRLDQVLKGLEETVHLVDEIAVASREQSDTIGQVSNAVRQMDAITQHNAGLVERTTAAVEQTEAQAAELDGIVDGFLFSSEADSASEGAEADDTADEAAAA